MQGRASQLTAAWLLQLCAVRLILATQNWYSEDESIAIGSLGCHFMNQDHRLGRVCVAHDVLFDRQQQEPGQIVTMLVSDTVWYKPTSCAAGAQQTSLVIGSKQLH